MHAGGLYNFYKTRTTKWLEMPGEHILETFEN